MSISTRLKSFLAENQIPYSIMTHTRAYTAQGAAATMQISGKELAKTVVLWTGEEMILAVLPAPNHVRLDKLAAEVGKSVRLATEAELSSLFPDCELGAMPPFGSLYNLPVYVDESLAADEAIVFNAGTHRDAIRMRYDDFVRLAKPRVCSFAQKACRKRSRVFFLVVCVAAGFSPPSSVGGIKLVPGYVAEVAIWVCWVNPVIHRTASHAAPPTLF